MTGVNHELLLSRKTCAELRGDQLNDNNELVNERFIFPNALCFCEYATNIARPAVQKDAGRGNIRLHFRSRCEGKPSTARVNDDGAASADSCCRPNEASCASLRLAHSVLSRSFSSIHGRRRRRSATGRLKLNMFAAMAQFEREIMRERQRKGIAKEKAQGKYRGRKSTARAKPTTLCACSERASASRTSPSSWGSDAEVSTARSEARVNCRCRRFGSASVSRCCRGHHCAIHYHVDHRVRYPRPSSTSIALSKPILELMATEDHEWVHPERRVMTMPGPRAVKFQRLLRDMNQRQRLADRRALLFMD